jgi:hypothetical protein
MMRDVEYFIQCVRLPIFDDVWWCIFYKLCKVCILYLIICVRVHMLYFVWCWIFYTMFELPILDDLWRCIVYKLSNFVILYLIICVSIPRLYYVEYWIFYTMFEVDYFRWDVKMPILYLCDVDYLIHMWVAYFISCVRLVIRI